MIMVGSCRENTIALQLCLYQEKQPSFSICQQLEESQRFDKLQLKKDIPLKKQEHHYLQEELVQQEEFRHFTK